MGQTSASKSLWRTIPTRMALAALEPGGQIQVHTEIDQVDLFQLFVSDSVAGLNTEYVVFFMI